MTDDQLKAFWQIAGQAEEMKRQAAHLREDADDLIDQAQDLERQAKALWTAVEDLGRGLPDPED